MTASNSGDRLDRIETNLQTVTDILVTVARRAESTDERLDWVSQAQDRMQIRWMSKSTLERVIAKLEKIGVVLSQKFNQRQRIKGNQTKWYRLDYKKLQSDYG